MMFLIVFAFVLAALLFPHQASASLSSVDPVPRINLPSSQALPSVPPSGTPGPAAGKAGEGKAGANADLREEIRSLARRGQLDSALALCRRALESDSNDAYARFMAGKLAPEGKASAEHFKRVLESGKRGPEAEESRFRLGQYYYASGKYYLAIPYFREYIRLHPEGDWKEPALYWMGRACLALAQSRPDRAAYLDSGLAYFQKLKDLGPAEGYYHALALEGMAKAKLARGDREGAWQDVQGALAMAPEDEQASILLLAAQLRRETDREEEARLLRKLAAEHPQSPEVRHLRRLNGSSDPARWRAPAPPAYPRPADSTLPAAGPAGPAVASAPGATVSPQLPRAGAAPEASHLSLRFSLQLGAFAQAANARSLMSDLAKMGFSPELLETSRGGKTIYQVRLGRFATAEAALEFARVNLKPRKILSQAVPLD